MPRPPRAPAIRVLTASSDMTPGAGLIARGFRRATIRECSSKLMASCRASSTLIEIGSWRSFPMQSIRPKCWQLPTTVRSSIYTTVSWILKKSLDMNSCLMMCMKTLRCELAFILPMASSCSRRSRVWEAPVARVAPEAAPAVSACLSIVSLRWCMLMAGLLSLLDDMKLEETKLLNMGSRLLPVRRLNDSPALSLLELATERSWPCRWPPRSASP